MTALSGGDRLESKPSPESSVLERPSPAASETPPGVRSVDRIFPLPGDATRGRQMQETWQAFCGGMDGAVRALLDKSRSPPEIAYAIGELVHNSFRTRGVTLTSFELRRLVAEVLAQQRQAPEPAPPDPALVVFTAEPAPNARPWTGDESAAPAPRVPDSVFQAPPSPLVELPVRDTVSFDGLLAAVVSRARARLKTGVDRAPVDRATAREAIDAVLGDFPAEGRERLGLLALSEICGLGLIDRLWADRSIQAVVVNGPDAVFVERHGVLVPALERFRDRAHLLDVVARLVRVPPSGIADFRLHDGSEGTLVAAPAGPVLVLRRGDPGAATFERLIASEMLDRPIAELLRIAARCRLDVLVAGPEGSGKTALLAAIGRDLGDAGPREAARIVTVARHRAFGWPSPSKVELALPSDTAGGASFSALLAAGVRLRPELLLVDSVQAPDLSALGAALGAALSRGERASVVAIPEAMAGVLESSVDLVVRLGRARDGLFHVVSVTDSSGGALFGYENSRFQRGTATPSFAGRVQVAGYGEALSAALR